MKKLILVLLFPAIFSFTGCSDDEPVDEVLLPSDLKVEVDLSEAGSGLVGFSASATNANFYNFYFDDKQEVPVRSNDGEASHVYATSGNYIVKIQAHVTAENFISVEKGITIKKAGDDGEIPAEGYTTPDNYEGMVLVWQDEFDGDELKPSNWIHERGTGSNGWGNNELQYYRTENTTVGDGVLIIEAREENFGDREYTSSRIITMGKQEFQYGRIDIRAILPKGQGIWPALWMLGSNFPTVGWPASGEIDIMEMIGGNARDNEVHGTVHWSNNGDYASYSGDYALTSGVFADKFHVFTLMWDESSIQWFVDDEHFHTIDITPEELSEFRQEFFFIFNIAVGGNWPGSPDESTTFPQRMVVDYVRVFQVQE